MTIIEIGPLLNETLKMIASGMAIAFVIGMLVR